jgi:hypothetical protein
MGVKVLKGRNVKVEVATVFGPAKAVTAISKASPPVASSAAHTLTNGTVGYWDAMSGMQELDGMACVVKNVAAGTFELPDVDSTNYTAFTSGSFVPVTTWQTLVNSTKVDIAGGDASKLNVTTLIDTSKQEENGMLAAQSVSIDVLSEQSTNAAAAFLKARARDGGFALMRLTYANGSVRVFRGQPSLPGESTGVDAVVSGSLGLTVKGYVIALDA